MSKLGLFSPTLFVYTLIMRLCFEFFQGMMVLPGAEEGEWHNVKMACIRESSFIS